MKIKPTGDRKRKGMGVEKGDGEKKNVFPSSFFLSVSFLVFSRASLHDRSRVLTKLSKIRKTSLNSLDFFDLFNLSHLVCL